MTPRLMIAYGLMALLALLVGYAIWHLNHYSHRQITRRQRLASDLRRKKRTELDAMAGSLDEGAGS